VVPGTPGRALAAGHRRITTGRRGSRRSSRSRGRVVQLPILDLWVADKGALAEGAGRYPLLDGGLVDVFKGAPAGKSLRGEPITAPLMDRNTITGGQPGQGKSASARVLMVGAALDPTAELRIWVPDTNFDFEVFKPRCSRYVMGAEDEKIAEILADLRELHAEVQRRGQILVDHETAAVTRELANRGIGLHPLFGQGAYRAGHRATELIPSTDRGTAVVKGFTGARSELLQWYFLSVDEGNDQVTPLIERSLDAIERRGKGLPGAVRPAPVVEAARDLLEDLDEVLGDEPVPAAKVPALLARHAPSWAPYKTLTGKALVERLAADCGSRCPRRATSTRSIRSLSVRLWPGRRRPTSTTRAARGRRLSRAGSPANTRSAGRTAGAGAVA
jgi:hypothetical protein